MNEQQLEFDFIDKSDTNFQKALAYIDQNNVFFRYKKLNWVVLLQFLKTKYNVLRATSYNSISMENKNQLAFTTYLSSNGYRCKTTDIKHSTNVDNIITTDLIRDSIITPSHKVIILVSSDNDYSYALNDASNRGFKIIVIGCKGNTGQELIKISDEVIYLEDIPGIQLEK